MPPAASERGPPPKLQDAALILPVLGACLLLPPLTDLFMAPVRIAGIPLIVLYIFGVWLGLILIALWLARRLRRPAAGRAPPWPEPGAVRQGPGPGLHAGPHPPEAHPPEAHPPEAHPPETHPPETHPPGAHPARRDGD